MKGKQKNTSDIDFGPGKVTVYLTEYEYEKIESIGREKFNDDRAVKGMLRTFAAIRLYALAAGTTGYVPIHSDIFKALASTKSYTRYRDALKDGGCIEYKDAVIERYEEKIQRGAETVVLNKIKTEKPMQYRTGMILSKNLFPSGKTYPVILEFSKENLDAIRSQIEHIRENYSGETDEEKVRYLTDTQFHDLLNVYDRTKNEATRKIMDMFLFSYYVCGLRYSDLLTLEWRHIDFESKTLTKNVYKTKRSISLPLVDKAVEILRRWQDIGHNRRFVFNLLDEKFNLSDTIKLNNARLTKNRNIQQSLRSVGIRMGLKFNLTIHVARHTFAVQALKNGMDVHTISHLMGHSSSLVTEKVYAKFLPDTINTTIREQLERNVIEYSSS